MPVLPAAARSARRVPGGREAALPPAGRAGGAWLLAEPAGRGGDPRGGAAISPAPRSLRHRVAARSGAGGGTLAARAGTMLSLQDSLFFEISIKSLLKSWSGGTSKYVACTRSHSATANFSSFFFFACCCVKLRRKPRFLAVLSTGATWHGQCERQAKCAVCFLVVM